MFKLKFASGKFNILRIAGLTLLVLLVLYLIPLQSEGGPELIPPEEDSDQTCARLCSCYMYFEPIEDVEAGISRTYCKMPSAGLNDSMNSIYKIGDVNSSLTHYQDFMGNFNYRDLSDWVYFWDNEIHEEIAQQPDLLTLAKNDCHRLIPSIPIIFISSWQYPVDVFFSRVYPKMNGKFILITASGDSPMPSSHFERFTVNNSSSKLVWWFGINEEFTSLEEKGKARFTHLPIGFSAFFHQSNMEFYLKRHRSDWDMPSLESDVTPLHLQRMFHFELEKFSDISKLPKLVSLNFAIETDPTGSRKKLWNTYCNEGNTVSQPIFNYSSSVGGDFASCLTKGMGVDRSNPKRMADIYEFLGRTPFWASPRGNGLDCHRTWEALRFGRIPIAPMNMHDLLHDLPAVLVADWEPETLTRSFLQAEFERIRNRLKSLDNPFNFAKMTMSHWRNLILEKANVLSLPERGPRCWGPG